MDDANGNGIMGMCYASSPSQSGYALCTDSVANGGCPDPNRCIQCVTTSCSTGQDCAAGELDDGSDAGTEIDTGGKRTGSEFPSGGGIKSSPFVVGVGAGKIDLGFLISPRFSDFMGLLNAVFTYLVYFAIPLAAIIFLLAGVVFVTSQGEPGKLETAKKMILWGVIGFSIVLLAKGIMTAILAFIS
jgi:hypothetical protein